jgi:hypothetical protein
MSGEEPNTPDSLVMSGQEPIQSENFTPSDEEPIKQECLILSVEEHKKERSNFVFKKLESLGSQQEILDYLTVEQLFDMNVLCFAFRRLWQSGAIPTKIIVNTVKVAHPKLLIAILSRPFVKSVVSLLDFSGLMFCEASKGLDEVVKITRK